MPFTKFPQYDPRENWDEWKKFSALHQLSWHLVDRAREAAREQALSYRPFRVGCAALAFNKDAYSFGEIIKVFTGANHKAEKEHVKMCAERVACFAARAAGYKEILGMVIAGDVQPDAESGHSSCTLHPCGDCRRILASMPEINPQMPVVTISLKNDEVYEEFTIRELLELHGTPIPSHWDQPSP